MKKILLVLFALTSVSAFSSEIINLNAAPKDAEFIAQGFASYNGNMEVPFLFQGREYLKKAKLRARNKAIARCNKQNAIQVEINYTEVDSYNCNDGGRCFEAAITAKCIF